LIKDLLRKKVIFFLPRRLNYAISKPKFKSWPKILGQDKKPVKRQFLLATARPFSACGGPTAQGRGFN
jgi:hypothetical protein